MPELRIAGKRWRLPKNRLLRILMGSLMVLGGFLGFLPILGFWMVPVGLLILSHDFHRVRRFRRRIAIWWGRRRQAQPA